jgi:hypothetical protein
VRNDVIEYLTPFLDGMNGDASSRVARACRVIDVVVREQLAAGRDKSELRYIFHREMFWKRLGALDDPAAKPLAKAARRPVDPPKLEEAPAVVRRPPSSPKADVGPPVDVETMRRDQERLWPEDPRPTSTPASRASQEDLAKELAEEIAKLKASVSTHEHVDLVTSSHVAPAKPGDLAKELAKELAQLRGSPAAADEEHEAPSTTLDDDELDEAHAELAEAESVRRAVWERETKELEEREEDAERMKRARWAERGEVFDVDERERSGVRSAAARSSEGRVAMERRAAA